MAEITAAAVNELRKKTGLPMMDVKKALNDAQGNEEEAIRLLRERGLKILGARSDRETSFGRFGLYVGTSATSGAMVELKCESAPVAANEEFVQLANDLAKQLATGPGAATGEELLDQASPSKPGMTLRQQKDDLFNRIREVFNVGRMVRFDGPCGGYSHNATTVSGVLLQVEGGNDAAAKDVCMHIAAMRPMGLTKEDVPADQVERERGILKEMALKEGKPVNIIDKIVEGQLRNFYAERVLTEQPFVKENKLTVGKFAEQHGMKLVKFVHWELGKSE
jgi:elongation factor Ts